MDTIPNKNKIGLITYSPKFSVVCSIGKAPFHGTIEIIHQPNQKILEYESFEKWLRTIASEEMTIEDLCRLVYDKLSSVLDGGLTVTVMAETTVHAPVSATISN